MQKSSIQAPKSCENLSTVRKIVSKVEKSRKICKKINKSCYKHKRKFRAINKSAKQLRKSKNNMIKL